MNLYKQITSLCSVIAIIGTMSACQSIEKVKRENSKNPTLQVITTNTLTTPPILEKRHSEYLQHFAASCITEEFPNKLNQVLANQNDIQRPKVLHPAFYGCFDWHSSVHGHWALVTLLNAFPDLKNADSIINKLRTHLTAENLQAELDYFQQPQNTSFERTYGWVWLFKLDDALASWDHPEANTMRQNLQPLTRLLESRLIDFLKKLHYPVRSGQHPNTAFALSFALDYAKNQQRTVLKQAIINSAKRYYLNDKACPLSWEPSGFDFLSGCLQEASLMQKVLPPKKFEQWVTDFLPGLLQHGELILTPASVSDRSDGKLAHLDGLNFSRAWCLFELGHALNNPKLVRLASMHFNTSYQKMDSGEYAGAHWLASFALYALATHKEGAQLNKSMSDNTH